MTDALRLSLFTPLLSDIVGRHAPGKRDMILFSVHDDGFTTMCFGKARQITSLTYTLETAFPGPIEAEVTDHIFGLNDKIPKGKDVLKIDGVAQHTGSWLVNGIDFKETLDSIIDPVVHLRLESEDADTLLLEGYTPDSKRSRSWAKMSLLGIDAMKKIFTDKWNMYLFRDLALPPAGNGVWTPPSWRDKYGYVAVDTDADEPFRPRVKVNTSDRTKDDIVVKFEYEGPKKNQRLVMRIVGRKEHGGSIENNFYVDEKIIDSVKEMEVAAEQRFYPTMVSEMIKFINEESLTFILREDPEDGDEFFPTLGLAKSWNGKKLGIKDFKDDVIHHLFCYAYSLPLEDVQDLVYKEDEDGYDEIDIEEE